VYQEEAEPGRLLKLLQLAELMRIVECALQAHPSDRRGITDSRPVEQHGKGHIEQHGIWSKRMTRVGSSNLWTASWRERGGSGRSTSYVDPVFAAGFLAGAECRAMISETPLRRSIIRHMFIILDLSDSMRDKDLRPSR
jgi:hypothetical protein